MGVRNTLILFLSTTAVSLVLLVVFFSLFASNIDFSFNTHLPDSAPDVIDFYKTTETEGKAKNYNPAEVNVPGESGGRGAAVEDPVKDADWMGASEQTQLPEEKADSTEDIPEMSFKEGAEEEDASEAVTPSRTAVPTPRPSLPRPSVTTTNSVPRPPEPVTAR